MASRRREALTQITENLARSQKAFSNTLSADFKPVNTSLLLLYRKTSKNVTNSIQTFIREVEQGQPQDPALRRLQDDAERAYEALQNPMLRYSQDLQASGLKRGIELGTRNLETGGIDDPTVDESLIDQQVFITERRDFRDTIRRYAPFFAAYLINQILSSNDRVAASQKLIRQVRNTTRSPLPQALTTLLQTTRTAQLWTARRANVLTYQQNGVQEWLWSAALDLRTCVSCWSMHGTRHPVTEDLNDHYNGRCAPIPITQTVARLLGGQFQTETPRSLDAQQYFDSLPSDYQRQILGAGRYTAYKAGLFNFQDMSKQVSVPIYGTMRVPKTLAELGIRQ